jgi:hypothetical protein
MAKQTMKHKVKALLDENGLEYGRNKAGDIVVRKGYFYKGNATHEALATRIMGMLTQEGLRATVVESYDQWAPFNGGASTAKNSHFAVVLRVTEEA